MTSPFVAGQKLTAEDLAALIPSIATKSVDETVNNSSAIQNDDELVLPLVANAVYVFDLVVIYSSGTTPDIKVGFTLPTGATTALEADFFDPSLIRNLIAQTTVPTTGIAMGGNAATTGCRIWGTVTTGATAGDMQTVWAQNTANASNTIVRAGSYLLVQRVI